MRRGLRGSTMRGVKYATSLMVDPPKPRFTAAVPGKSAATSGHMRMEELPRNITPPAAGGRALSAASNARISGSKSAAVDGACRDAVDALADADPVGRHATANDSHA